MMIAPVRRLLLVGALCASAGGMAACGSDELATDVRPERLPALTAPTGDGLAAGAGDQATEISDLPSSVTTTGPTPAAAAEGDAAADTATSDDTATDSAGQTASPGAASSTGGTATSSSGTAAGSGGTGGTSTPSGGSSGTSTSSGAASSSGTSTSSGSTSSGSGGGATPSEFGEFCDTNPGVCR
jgi:hypothetical protein